jgi:hypothetical protein
MCRHLKGEELCFTGQTFGGCEMTKRADDIPLSIFATQPLRAPVELGLNQYNSSWQ